MAAINTEMIRERVIRFLQEYREYVKKLNERLLRKLLKSVIE